MTESQVAILEPVSVQDLFKCVQCAHGWSHAHGRLEKGRNEEKKQQQPGQGLARDTLKRYKQKHTWDCGLACTAMIVNSWLRRPVPLQTHGGGRNFPDCTSPSSSYTDMHVPLYGQLKAWVGTESIWTVDLAVLLERCGIRATLLTVKMGINEQHGTLPFYVKDNCFQSDAERVRGLFAKLQGRQSTSSGIGCTTRAAATAEGRRRAGTGTCTHTIAPSFSTAVKAGAVNMPISGHGGAFVKSSAGPGSMPFESSAARALPCRLRQQVFDDAIRAGCTLLVLVDQRLLDCRTCGRVIPQGGPYLGHYIVVVGIVGGTISAASRDASNGMDVVSDRADMSLRSSPFIQYLNPDERAKCTVCTITSAALTAARLADGTDEDVILIHEPARYQQHN